MFTLVAIAGLFMAELVNKKLRSDASGGVASAVTELVLALQLKLTIDAAEFVETLEAADDPSRELEVMMP